MLFIHIALILHDTILKQTIICQSKNKDSKKFKIFLDEARSHYYLYDSTYMDKGCSKDSGDKINAGNLMIGVIHDRIYCLRIPRSVSEVL